MNKTIALFTTVIAMIFISGIFAYVNTQKIEPAKTENIVIEEVKTEKKHYEPVLHFTPSKAKEDSPYKYDYPFYGMEEEYVEKTILGKADIVNIDSDDYDGFTITTKSYIWLNSNGTYKAYAITGADIYDRSRRIVYSFTDCSKKTYYSSNKGSSKSDPYNAKDYGYADDFYDEYYDDFYDYEDAEDYWMDHQ